MKPAASLQRHQPVRRQAAVAHTILVVDDRPELLGVTSLILERFGYQVVQAASGREAQKLAQQHPELDLLLTDLEMPEMGGEELAAWFRAHRPTVRIVFMSGNAQLREHLGFCHFLPKPFASLELVEKTIAAALRGHPSPGQLTSAKPCSRPCADDV